MIFLPISLVGGHSLQHRLTFPRCEFCKLEITPVSAINKQIEITSTNYMAISNVPKNLGHFSINPIIISVQTSGTFFNSIGLISRPSCFVGGYLDNKRRTFLCCEFCKLGFPCLCFTSMFLVRLLV